MADGKDYVWTVKCRVCGVTTNALGKPLVSEKSHWFTASCLGRRARKLATAAGFMKSASEWNIIKSAHVRQFVLTTHYQITPEDEAFALAAAQRSFYDFRKRNLGLWAPTWAVKIARLFPQIGRQRLISADERGRFLARAANGDPAVLRDLATIVSTQAAMEEILSLTLPPRVPDIFDDI